MFKAQIVPVTAFAQNCAIIWCDETMEGALVDPGGDIDRVLAKAKELDVKVTKILLTHGHLDHAGGALDLREQLKIPVIGPHKDDQFWLSQIEDNASRYGMTGMKNVVPDEWLEDGATVSLGNLTLQVRHCPGHTPGHIVFFEEESRVAFVGDVIFKGSVGRTDFPKGDQKQLVQSIVEKLWPLGDDVTFVPGHGPLSTFGAEREDNPYVADKVMAATG